MAPPPQISRAPPPLIDQSHSYTSQTSTAGAELLYDCIAEHAMAAVGAPSLTASGLSLTEAASETSYADTENGSRGQSPPPHLFLDLCCGNGAIGIWLARRLHAERIGAPFERSGRLSLAEMPDAELVGADVLGAEVVGAEVLGIELSAAAASDAEFNARLNGVRYRVIRGRVEEELPRLLDEHCPASGAASAIVDPPRTGLSSKVCRALRASPALRHIVYVSCNPLGHQLRTDYVVRDGSLAENVRCLCDQKGRGRPFRITSATPVDLFPHTPHCELVLVLERGK